MINEELTALENIKEKVKQFIDNNGDTSCDYCNGLQSIDASENPKKAVVSLATDRASSYEAFVAVQDALTKAYFELRISFAHKTFNKSLEELTREELRDVKQAYPFIISEAEIKHTN